MCDFCNVKLTKCTDDDTNHYCDVCEAKLNKCVDSDPSDHICDYCQDVISECIDYDKDHECDVCRGEFSECEDEDKDHLCDVCDTTLTECTDRDGNYECDVCLKQFPYITFTASEGCLVNGKEREEVYLRMDTTFFIFSCIDERQNDVAYWIVVEAERGEIATVAHGMLFKTDEAGDYRAIPVFK